MKNMIICLILSFISFNASSEEYFGLQINELGGDVSAIAGLLISGQRYDVSFDGAFGTTDVATLGIDADDALYAIQGVANFGRQPYTRYNLLTFTNGPTGLIGQRLQVQFNATEAYSMQYGAGWYDEGLQPLDTDYLAYFRLAIPNSLNNLYNIRQDNPIIPGVIYTPNVPEPSEYALLLVGLFIAGIAVKLKV